MSQSDCKLCKIAIVFQSKINGKEEPVRGAGSITDDVADTVDELYHFQVPLPDSETITKAVRHYRQELEPKQPKVFKFVVSLFTIIAPKSKLYSDKHAPWRVTFR